MQNNSSYLKAPLELTKQIWPEGTVPLVATSTNTYNQAPYIRQCIEGILMQKTTFPVKVVIFDDCSIDGTREIVKEYESNYPNLIKGIYPKENTWKKPGRKEALKPRNEERGVAKYIALCEGDDYWIDPLKLQTQVEYLETNEDFGLICSDYNLLNVETGENETEKLNRHYQLKNNFEFGLEEYLRKRSILRTLTTMFRTKFIAGYIEETEEKIRKNGVFGDVPFWMYILSKSKGYYLATSLATYRFIPGTASRPLTDDSKEYFQKTVSNIIIHQANKYLPGHPVIKDLKIKNLILEMEWQIQSQQTIGVFLSFFRLIALGKLSKTTFQLLLKGIGIVSRNKQKKQSLK